jgi:pimeloyl-ACP methyl ester carboxylesterase
MAALDESDLPDDEPFREAVRSHIEFGSRVAMQNSNADTDEDLHPLREVPRWTWAGDGSMIELGDVSTWWEVEGDGEPLVLLHPGGADSRAYDDNLPGLAKAFRCYRYDRRGQGRTPDVGGPITFAAMTDDAIAFIETAVGAPAHLVGHSIGAPVGLLVAQKRPDLVRGLVFSEGVFHHDGWIPGVLDPLPPDVHEFLGGLYAEVSPHGAEHWPHVWARLDHEHHRAPALTTDDLAAIAVPTLLMFADNETEVRTEHMHAMHRALPNAQLAVIPGTGHGLLADKPDLCNRIITEFLAYEP